MRESNEDVFGDEMFPLEIEFDVSERFKFFFYEFVDYGGDKF